MLATRRGEAGSSKPWGRKKLCTNLRLRDRSISPWIERATESARLVQVRGHVQHPTVLGEEVAEVQCAHLRLLALGLEQRVHRSVEDRSLYQGTRVHAEYGRGMEHRVEVVVAGCLIHGICPVRWIHGHAGHRAQPGPGRTLHWVLWVWPDEHLQIVQALVAGPETLDPAQRNRRFAGGDERRRAHVEHERAFGVEVQTGAELLARGTWLPAEPVVVGHSASYLDPVLRQPVKIADLGDLELVPDRDQIRSLVKDPFVGQVVPARDGNAGRQTESPRYPQVLRLWGGQFQ